MLVITTLAIWGTMQGRGPFLAQAPAENALELQVFLLMMATPLMLLAVAIDDERRSKEALRVSEERMVGRRTARSWRWGIGIWRTTGPGCRTKDESPWASPDEPIVAPPGRTRSSRRSRRACGGDPARAGDFRVL